MKKILVLGPNPAWQKTLLFDRFTRGEVNRAAEMTLSASGKGINFSRAVRCCGKAESLLVQFCGGATGHNVDAALKREGVPVISIATANPTRCCTTCLDRQDETMTEIIDPSFAASEAEVGSFLEAVRDEAQTCDALACCGTLPTGTDPQLYARAAHFFAGKTVLVDAFKEITGVFGAARQLILKINREELQKLTGAAAIPDGLKLLFARPDAPRFAAITDGERAACASDGRTLMRYELPRLDKVVNPLGSGDTASAVLLSEILSGMPFFEAFRPALAAASANCLELRNGFFEPAAAAEIAAGIRMQPCPEW